MPTKQTKKQQKLTKPKKGAAKPVRRKTTKAVQKSQKKQCKISNKGLFIVCIILLILVIAAVVAGIVTTAARYATQVSGSAKTNVAKWSAVIKDGDYEPMETNFVLDLIPWNDHTQVANGKIAPGSSAIGYFYIDLHETEVTTDIEVTATYNPALLPEHTYAKLLVEDMAGIDFCEEDPTDSDHDGVITCTGTVGMMNAKLHENQIYGEVGYFWDEQYDENDELTYEPATDDANDTADGVTANTLPMNINIKAAQHFE